MKNLGLSFFPKLLGIALCFATSPIGIAYVHIICVAGLPQKRELDTKIAVRFPYFYQIFRETSTIVVVVTNNVSNVA